VAVNTHPSQIFRPFRSCRIRPSPGQRPAFVFEPTFHRQVIVGRRILNGDTSIRLTYMIFDLLGVDGTSLIERPHEERRSVLEQLDLQGPYWSVTETFDVGEALFGGVCELGLEGVVAKQTTSRYGATKRGWVKVKNLDTGVGTLNERRCNARERRR